MTSGYLYIAKDRSRPDQLKVGFTTKSLGERQRGLRGCADTDFDILRAFPTEAPREAEAIAHERLDRQNLRVHAETRREQFVNELALVTAICARAAQDAKPFTRQMPAETLSAAVTLSHEDPFWACLLEMPIQLTRERATLGSLMEQVLKSGSSVSTLKLRFGIECAGFSFDAPQFLVHWPKATNVLKWLTQRGHSIPQAAISKTTFKADWHETGA